VENQKIDNLINHLETDDAALYALLEQAMTVEDERLTVREDLIQRTLARVAEDNPDGKEAEIVSMPSVKMKKSLRTRVMSYAGVAAAAVLVLVVGQSMLSGSSQKSESFVGKSAMEPAGSDEVQPASMESDAMMPIGETKEYSKAGESVTDGIDSSKVTNMVPSTSNGGSESEGVKAFGWNVRKVCLTDETVEAFRVCGIILTDTQTEECYGEFAKEVDWNDLLPSFLPASGATLLTKYPVADTESSSWLYELIQGEESDCHILRLLTEDGEIYVILTKQSPNYRDVRIQVVKPVAE